MANFKTVRTGLALLLILTLLVCGATANNKKKCTENEQVKGLLMEEIKDVPKPEDDGKDIVSTYDKDGVGSDGLAYLSGEGVFAFFHKKAFPQLVENHKNYFNSKPDFELLYSTKGDLFHNGKDDYAFIVHDKKKSIIIILLYDESANKYSELYRDIKVEGELEDCHFSYYGTLDYIIGEELINYGLSLEYVEDFLEDFKPCMITNVLQNKNFLLNKGCFAKDVSRKSPLNSLCIGTSYVYNSWTCLFYDKSKNRFKVVYGQAFSD